MPFHANQRSEQSRPPLIVVLSDNDTRDEHLFSLFQVTWTKSAHLKFSPLSSAAAKGQTQFMKKAISLLMMSFMGMVGTYAWAGTARENSVARLQSSVEVLQAIMATPDKGIPEEVLNDSKCILVVPNLIKGGFIVGGKHGRGVASCRTAEGWAQRGCILNHSALLPECLCLASP